MEIWLTIATVITAASALFFPTLARAQEVRWNRYVATRDELERYASSASAGDEAAEIARNAALLQSLVLANAAQRRVKKLARAGSGRINIVFQTVVCAVGVVLGIAHIWLSIFDKSPTNGAPISDATRIYLSAMGALLMTVLPLGLVTSWRAQRIQEKNALRWSHLAATVRGARSISTVPLLTQDAQPPIGGQPGDGILSIDQKDAAPSTTELAEPQIRKSWVRFDRGGIVKKQINVVGAVIIRSGEILCAQRGTGALAGLWEFPGGKIEAGESPREALEREIREELDCEISVGEQVEETAHEYDFGVVNLTTFYCDLVSGTPKLTEHTAVVWLAPDRLDDLEWAPADIPAVRKIEQCFVARDA